MYEIGFLRDVYNLGNLMINKVNFVTRDSIFASMKSIFMLLTKYINFLGGNLRYVTYRTLSIRNFVNHFHSHGQLWSMNVMVMVMVIHI
jgi:hypothetical protein